MELEIDAESGNVIVTTESFAEELLYAESTAGFLNPAIRGLFIVASKLRLLKRYERNFEPHGHTIPVEGLAGIWSAGVVLGVYGKKIRGAEAPLATAMSNQIQEFLH